MKKYYIVSKKYVGPNFDQHLDNEMAWIQTLPARTNMSHEKRTKGWLGTTNDWSYQAHGEFHTLDEAKAALAALYPDYREVGEDELRQYQWLDERDGNTMLNAVRAGKYAQMGSDESANFCYESFHRELTAETTDEEIEKLIELDEEFCNDEWRATLNKEAARRYAEELRKQLREKADD